MNPSAEPEHLFPSKEIVNKVKQSLTVRLNAITQTIPFIPKSRYDKKPEYFKLEVQNDKVVLTIDNALKNYGNSHVIPEQIRQINKELNLIGAEYQLKQSDYRIDPRGGTTTYTITIEQRQLQLENASTQFVEQ